MRWALCILLVVLLVAGLAATPLLFHEYRSSLTRDYSFVLPHDFEHTRKVMVRTDASDRLLRAGGGRIVTKQVDNLNLATDRLINGNWIVVLQARLTLAVPGTRGGEMLLPVSQSAKVQPRQLVSVVQLAVPVGDLHGYHLRIIMQPSSGGTLVLIRTFVDIRFRAPLWPGVQQNVDARVAEGMKQNVHKMCTELAKVTDEYKGRRLFLKLN